MGERLEEIRVDTGKEGPMVVVVGGPMVVVVGGPMVAAVGGVGLRMEVEEEGEGGARVVTPLEAQMVTTSKVVFRSL